MTSEFWKGAASPRILSEANFITAAARIGCEPETLKAVWEVEASGQCFDRNGGVVKRFEPHLMPRENWERMGFVPRRNQPAWRASSALSETVRWQMFEVACRINPENAARATSWGGSQILGRWFAELGYSSAVEMVQGFADSAANQLDGFVTLVESWGLVSALRARDWHRFATRWNGSGQPAVYAGRMETAYRRLTGEPSAVVLHPGASGPAVRVLQRALGIPDTGSYDPASQAAVEAFQRANGLKVDGVVGANTWRALQAAERPPAQPTEAETRPTSVLRDPAMIGAAVPAVTAVATMSSGDGPIQWAVAAVLIVATLVVVGYLVLKLKRGR